MESVLPFLQSMGVSPEQLGPEKMSALQKLCEAISDPSNIDENTVNNIINTMGIKAKGEPKIPKKRGDKVGRNDKCPCNSGKKHKKCCMKIC